VHIISLLEWDIPCNSYFQRSTHIHLHICESSRLHFHSLHLLLIVSQGGKRFPKKQGCSSYHLPQIKRKKCKINPKVGSFIKFKDLFQFFFLLGIILKKREKKDGGHFKKQNACKIHKQQRKKYYG
jgi:hypothetical protein